MKLRRAGVSVMEVSLKRSPWRRRVFVASRPLLVAQQQSDQRPSGDSRRRWAAPSGSLVRGPTSFVRLGGRSSGKPPLAGVDPRPTIGAADEIRSDVPRLLARRSQGAPGLGERGLASTMVAAAPLANFHHFVHWVGIGLVFTNGVGLSGLGLARLADAVARRWALAPWVRWAALAVGLALAGAVSAVLAASVGALDLRRGRLRRRPLASVPRLGERRGARERHRHLRAAARARSSRARSRAPGPGERAARAAPGRGPARHAAVQGEPPLPLQHPQHDDRARPPRAPEGRADDPRPLRDLPARPDALGLGDPESARGAASRGSVPRHRGDPDGGASRLVRRRARGAAGHAGAAARGGGARRERRAARPRSAQGGGRALGPRRAARRRGGHRSGGRRRRALGPEEEAGRFGLRSIRERMALLHQDRALLRLEPREGGGTRALLEVPL